MDIDHFSDLTQEEKTRMKEDERIRSLAFLMILEIVKRSRKLTYNGLLRQMFEQLEKADQLGFHIHPCSGNLPHDLISQAEALALIHVDRKTGLINITDHGKEYIKTFSLPDFEKYFPDL